MGLKGLFNEKIYDIERVYYVKFSCRYKFDLKLRNWISFCMIITTFMYLCITLTKIIIKSIHKESGAYKKKEKNTNNWANFNFIPEMLVEQFVLQLHVQLTNVTFVVDNLV